MRDGLFNAVRGVKALFGVVSLLLALAIVGLIAVKQWKAVARAPSSAPTAGTHSPNPQLLRSDTVPVRIEVRSLQQQVADEAAKAMSDAEAERERESGKQ